MQLRHFLLCFMHPADNAMHYKNSAGKLPSSAIYLTIHRINCFCIICRALFVSKNTSWFFISCCMMNKCIRHRNDMLINVDTIRLQKLNYFQLLHFLNYLKLCSSYLELFVSGTKKRGICLILVQFIIWSCDAQLNGMEWQFKLKLEEHSLICISLD